MRLRGLTLPGRRPRAPSRRWTGQGDRGGLGIKPAAVLLERNLHFIHQVPHRPSAGSARRNATHALPARALAPS
jgi:hypothetical protein